MIDLVKPSPILRWAGGKSWLLSKLPELLPNEFNNYHEPFLGGASVYLFLKKNDLINGTSYLSDLNPSLINCYRQLRNNYPKLIGLLKKYRNNERYYYTVRERESKNSIEEAANFLYLNRTSFNGIFRVNLNGVYNVPYGFKSYHRLFDYEDLNNVRILLRNAKLVARDFEESLSSVKKGDLIFIDPPYTIAHNHNGFIKYNQKLFLWSDQERLLEYVRILNRRKAFFILTNAAHKSIRNLFKNDSLVKTLTRPSLVGGKGAERGSVSEYLFTNIIKS